MLFHLVNIGIQYVGEKKILNIRVFMQIPVAIFFGWLIDLVKMMMSFQISDLAGKFVLLALSIFFTAAGMACMIEMHLIQNPPDGTVAMISDKTGSEIGKIKIIYDIAMTVMAIVISFLVLKKVEGFGIATIASALFVGRTLTGIRKIIKFNV